MTRKLVAAGLTMIALLSWSGNSAFAGKGGGRGGNSGTSTTSGSATGGSGHVSGTAPGGAHVSRGAGAPTGAGGAAASGARIYSARAVNQVYGGQAVRGSAFRQGQGTHLTAHHGSGVKKTSTSLGTRSERSTGMKSGGASDASHTAGLKSKKTGGSSASAVAAGSQKKGEIHSSRHNPANKNRFDAATQSRLRNWQGKKSDVAEATRRHRGDGTNKGANANKGNHHGHCHHDHDWWRHHCNAIILVDWGWWGWWDGWWYPAWGYDVSYSNYDFDGPVYDYGGLPPDEVVANVQTELQKQGYFTFAADGVLGPLTQNALMRYQRDHRLPITGTIDPATTGSLNLAR